MELGGGIGNQTILLIHAQARSVTVTEIDDSRHNQNRAMLELNKGLLHNLDGTGSVVTYIVQDWMRF